MWKLIGNIFRCSVARHLNIKNPVGVANPSGRQPGTEGLLRNDRKFLQQSLQSKMQVGTYARKASGIRQLNDDHTQPFLYRTPKLVMLHRRNAELDYQGNFDIPFLDPSINFDNRAKLNKKSPRAQVPKVTEKLPVELVPIMQTRSYAQMIADYSKSIEKQRLKESPRQSPRGLLSSFSLMARRYAQEPNFTLTENKSRKSSPNVRNSQKRDYVTKHLKNLRVEETWGSRFLNNSPKTDFEHEFDLDYKAIDRIEREKENITARWVQAIQPKKKPLPMNLNVKDSAIQTVNEKVKIKTSADKIEIEIPIASHEKVGSVLEKKLSIINVQISARTLEEVRGQSKFTDCQVISRCNSNSACDRSNCNGDDKFDSTKKDKGKSSTLKGLPWWASSECSAKTNTKVSKTTECLNEVYSKDQNTVQVLATEDISTCNDKVIKVVRSIEPRLSSTTSYRLRRRKKNSSIAKVTKHIEEKLQKKKKQMEEESKATVIKKNQSEEAEKVPDDKDKVDGGKKNNDGSKQSKANEDEEQKLKSSARKVSSAASNPQQNVSLDSEIVKNSSKESKANAEAALAKSEKSNNDELTNSRRKGKGTEYRSKRIPDVLKPIEKRDDGTLIDYGLKVPTRKPRLKRPSEKSNNLPGDTDKSPKKTISAPQNELSALKTGIPVMVGSDLPQKHLSQTRSELPLMNQTLAFSKTNPIKEESNENLQQVQDSILPEKFKSKLPKLNSLGNFVPEKFPNRGSNALKVEQIQARSRVRERLGKAPVVEMTANSGDDDHNPEMLEIRNKIRQRLGLPLIAYDPIQGYSIIPHSESNLSLESDQSDKELIYSAWLNRFHTRKHNVLIK